MDQKDLKQVREIVKDEFNHRFDELEEKLEEKMFEWKSEIVSIVDGLALEIRDNREFRDIASHQIGDNTKRIDRLEKKVFAI